MPRGVPNVPSFETQISPETFNSQITANLLADEVAMANNFSAELNRNQPVDDGIDKSFPYLAYWKYCVAEDCYEPGHVSRRGHIVVGPSKVHKYGPPQCQEFAEAYHAESLEDKYGPLPQNAPNQPGPRVAASIPGRPASWAEELFKKPGGFGEMPASQWKELRLHKYPNLAKYRPEITQADFIECELCPKGQREFVEMAHLAAHQEALHPDQRSNIAVAEAMGRVMNDKQGGDVNAALLAMITELKSELDALKNPKEN